MLLIAQGITSGGVLQTNSSGDIASVADVDILTVVCMHLQDTADTLVLILNRVVNSGASLNGTRVHAEEAQLTDIRVSHNLECQCRERLIIGRSAIFFLASLRVVP